jgi:DNA-binding CsgD family transcriptional regulator
MAAKVDYLKKRFEPMQQKSLHHALIRLLGEQFPKALGGERMRATCAEMILEVVGQHRRGREQLSHGQLLWAAIDKDDPPARGKTIGRTRLLPVILTLSCNEDIDRRIDRVAPPQRLLHKAVRLCQQAFEQGGLLSNSDLAELLCADPSYIGQLLAAYERQQNRVVPRRATVHDLGTGLTHKRIVCWKRYVEGKSSEQIARETYHSIEAVDRYLGQFDRVRHLRLERQSAERIAYFLNCSVPLVQQYLDIDRELEQTHD